MANRFFEWVFLGTGISARSFLISTVLVIVFLVWFASAMERHRDVRLQEEAEKGALSHLRVIGKNKQAEVLVKKHFFDLKDVFNNTICEHDGIYFHISSKEASFVGAGRHFVKSSVTVDFSTIGEPKQEVFSAEYQTWGSEPKLLFNISNDKMFWKFFNFKEPVDSEDFAG